MLHRMQAKYSEKPVRFLLFPCNQFANQEPKPNAEVKKFAESQSVSLATGAAGNVVMFAKSSLNSVPCVCSGADACLPASAECCPKNDAVYDYLLAATPPHTIKWNFDKIVVGKDGRPYPGGAILHGGDLDERLGGIIDELLGREAAAAALAASLPPHKGRGPALLLAGAGAAALLALLALLAASSARAAGAGEEASESYFLVA